MRQGEASIDTSAQLGRIGIVARWQPVHKGHAPVLRALCSKAKHAFIGIGSSNKYNLRNPFTLEERKIMLKLTLGEWGNYTLIPVPDLDDGPRWGALVKELFGNLDVFMTENPYVSSLLADEYQLMKPLDLIHVDDRIPIDGSKVRHWMASGQNWQKFVPDAIADYISSNQLDVRFRQEFGLQTLALKTILK